MTKSTITRERLEWLSQISCRDDIEDIGGDEIRELASMALAAMDSEPVAVCIVEDGQMCPDGFGECDHSLPDGTQKLFAAPQPAPVVPEEKPIPNTLSMYAVDAVAAIAEVKGWNACRAVMLDNCATVESRNNAGCSPKNGLKCATVLQAEPVTTANKLGNSPAIPDGYVMVPKEPTKEMINAGWLYYMGTKNPSSKGTYKAMLAAAPQELK